MQNYPGLLKFGLPMAICALLILQARGVIKEMWIYFGLAFYVYYLSSNFMKWARRLPQDTPSESEQPTEPEKPAEPKQKHFSKKLTILANYNFVDPETGKSIAALETHLKIPPVKFDEPPTDNDHYDLIRKFGHAWLDENTHPTYKILGTEDSPPRETPGESDCNKHKH